MIYKPLYPVKENIKKFIKTFRKHLYYLRFSFIIIIVKGI